MIRALALALALAACGDNIAEPGPDAALDIDAGVTTPDASTLDAYDPFGDPPTALCADVCPGEALTPWYSPANVYAWSYCRPSYRRCIDPTAPICQGCPS